MDTTQAHTLALDLMRQHGVTHTFRWSNATTFAGQVVPSKRLLQLSKPWVAANTEESVRDTILHEIAHVLSPPIWRNGRWSKHGPEFKRTLLSIGGDGRTTTKRTDVSVRKPKANRYEARCPGHGTPHVAARYARKPGRGMLLGAVCTAHSRTPIVWWDVEANAPLLGNTPQILRVPVAAQTSPKPRARKNFEPVDAPPWVAGSSNWDDMFNR